MDAHYLYNDAPFAPRRTMLGWGRLAQLEQAFFDHLRRYTDDRNKTDKKLEEVEQQIDRLHGQNMRWLYGIIALLLTVLGVLLKAKLGL